MDRLAAVVILYHPDKSVVSNISSYLPWVSDLYVYDNSIERQSFLQNEIEELSNKIVYHNHSDNKGVAYCLNAAAKMAISNGFEWLLTMDQDSYFNENSFEEYVSLTEIAINSFVSISMLTVPNKPVINELDSLFKQVSIAITSGSIVNLPIWQKLGGFEESLFIDEVDTDFILKSKLNNYQIIQCNSIVLQHQLGTKIKKGYAGIAKKRRTIHSPKRVYYMVRNYLFIAKKYGASFPEDIINRRNELLVSLKNNLFFSGHFLQVFVSIYKAYFHFKKGIFGKQ